ncbi:MAG: glycosyltransferase family 4 protein [Prevotella sp.]|nr:glycosyltransferase family 4 protein [Prevotella sp.]
MKKMRILYVDSAVSIYGGLERVLVDKLNWLVNQGNCDICLLTANQGTRPIVYPLHENVVHHDLDIQFHHVYRYSGWKRLREEIRLHKLFRQRLAKEIRDFSPQVVVCTRLQLLNDVVSVKGSVPVVLESHNICLAPRYEGYGWFNSLKYWYWRRAVRKVQTVVALTQGDAVEWRKHTPHVSVIPDVVHLNDTGRVSDVSSKSVIFVGRYSSQKGIDTLLSVWQIVFQRHPDWQLHIFGGYGDQSDILIPQIKSMGDSIVLHEPTSAIFDEYLKSSVLLMTSYYEPFGLVLPEAMSCGLPVVAFDCPYGPASIITDGVDGFLIPNRDIQAYAEKLCLLMDDDELRRTMGQAGIISSRRYDLSDIMPLWKDFLQHRITK